MLFRESNGNTALAVEYSNNTLRLQSNLNSSGSSTGQILNDVFVWIVPDIDDEWVHICIQVTENSNRAWFNGEDEGITSAQGSYSNHNFGINRIATFAPIKYEAVDNAIGPLFFDLKKAWRPMVAGNITVPARPVDFYNLKSGVNLTELNDVNEFETFVDGDILTYYQDGFHKGKPFYSKYKFNINSAPTGVIANSQQIGTGNGFWRPLTSEHYSTNSQGPRTTDRDPTFEAEETLGQFLVPVDGIYHIIANVTICRNNLSADTYYTNEIILDTSQSMLTTNERSCHLSFATNSSAPTSIIRQTATIHTIERIDGDTLDITVRLSDNQSDEFYVEEAFLTFHKVG